MTWNITDRFPNWGETGETPPDGFFYDGGDQVNEKHLDYLWNSVKGLEDDVQSALDDIDSNADGVVDKADLADSLTNFDEKAQDAVGTIISGSGGTTVTYDDSNNSITVDSTSLTEEQLEDVVASLVSSDSNLSWSYDDPNDTLLISLSNSISVGSFEATATITDPSGTSHESELADSDDIVDDYRNLTNTPTETAEFQSINGYSEVVNFSDSVNYSNEGSPLVYNNTIAVPFSNAIDIVNVDITSKRTTQDTTVTASITVDFIRNGTVVETFQRSNSATTSVTLSLSNIVQNYNEPYNELDVTAEATEQFGFITDGSIDVRLLNSEMSVVPHKHQL